MGKHKKKIQPNILSDVLITEFVFRKDDNVRFTLESQWSLSKSFDDSVVLYKIAVVLLALLNVERDNDKFAQVRFHFEKTIFTDDNIEKLNLYSNVKSAMDKLGELLDIRNYNIDDIQDQNRLLPWTMACLRETGILQNDQPIAPQSRASAIGMGWAKAWLREIGIVERNPITLSLFSHMWITHYLFYV